MKFVDIKKIAAISALGLVAVLGTSIEANAQYGRQSEQDRIYRQQQEDAQRIAQEQQDRQDDLDRRRQRSGNDRSNGNGYWNGNANGNSNRNHNRYRVNRNGRYYNTDQRVAELLRRAVNAGYQQGYQAGLNDRNRRRRSGWNNNSMYNSGNYGYQTYVDRNQYQYYFQQGFQKGYQDGYNTRNQYGSNGTNILGSILGQILNIQTY
jgi:hypothetical protein